MIDTPHGNVDIYPDRPAINGVIWYLMKSNSFQANSSLSEQSVMSDTILDVTAIH